MSTFINGTSQFIRRRAEIQIDRQLIEMDRIEQAVDDLYRFGQHAIAHRPFEDKPLTDDEVMADPVRRRAVLNLTRELAELSVIYGRALDKIRAKLGNVRLM